MRMGVTMFCTALREANEEIIGLDPQNVHLLSRMGTIESKHSLCVTPIIGVVHLPVRRTMSLNVK